MKFKKRGSSALAYGLIVGLISVVALVAVTNVGSSNKVLMEDVAGTLTGVVPSAEPAASASASASASPVTLASCKQILDGGGSTGDGSYTINRGGGDETVYCDMSGGGWTWPMDDATTYNQTVLYLESDMTNNPSVNDMSPNLATVATTNASYQSVPAYFGSNSLYVSGHIDITGLPALSGDFTIDFWTRVRSGGLGSMCAPYFAFNNHGSTGGLTLFNCTSTLANIGAGMFLGADSWANSSDASNGIIGADTWRHIAITRQGSTIRQFVDGSEVHNNTYSTSITQSPLRLAKRADNDPYQMDLYFEEFRIINGTARWTSNFTPPTEPYRFQ